MRFLAALAVLALSSPATAQQSNATAATVDSAPPKLSAYAMREQEKISVELYREQLRLTRARNTRLIAEDRHAMFTYWKQSVIDVFLTLFVMLIVTVGIYLSYLQFRADHMPSARRKRRDRAADSDHPADGAADRSRTDFKISKSGVEMSSSVIGLFILLASMFFFYLYIEKVYPVNVTPQVTKSK